MERSCGASVVFVRRLWSDFQSLLVIITEKMLTDTEIRIIQLVENLHRSSLSGYDRWRACEELKAMNPDFRAKDLAEKLRLDASMIVRLMSPSSCLPEIQDALKAGEITLSDCYAMSKSKSPADQAKLLALKLSGASRDQIEAQARKQRNGTPAVMVSRIKCPLPSGAVVQVSGREISLDGMIEAISELLKEAKRAGEQGWDVKTFRAGVQGPGKGKVILTIHFLGA